MISDKTLRHDFSVVVEVMEFKLMPRAGALAESSGCFKIAVAA